MKKIKVLFLGSLSGTSLDRLNGLKRLGCCVTAIDPRKMLPRSNLIDKIEWHASPSIIAPFVSRSISKVVSGDNFDLVFVDSGSLVSPDLIDYFKRSGSKVVNYNHDDPFGPRDWTRFSLYRKAASVYDLLVVVRKENIDEAYEFGARNVLHLFRLADEVTHNPRPIDSAERRQWSHDVVFVGTWMPERGPFIKGLIDRGINIQVFGSGWSKAPEWSFIRSHVSERPLKGDDYAYAIQCAKVCLGLLSKDNRDLHTTRSLEIPSLGGLLCAQRTSEHSQMYQEGLEAVFWSDVDECATVCATLLGDEVKRNQIAQAGRERFLRSGHTTENMLRVVIAKLFDHE